MEVDSSDLLHAVFDHLRGEEVLFSLLLHGDLTVVLLEGGGEGISAYCLANTILSP